MSRSNKPPPKDMYWFAHGGAENEKNLPQRNAAQGDYEEEQHSSGSQVWNMTERKGSPDDLRTSLSAKDSLHTVTDGGSSSSGPSSLERDDRLRTHDKRIAVEERKKQLWEAEQVKDERNDALLKKHMEREAALEARRNAQRSTISFAFGSSRPRNIETLHTGTDGDSDIMSRSFTAGGLSQKGEDVMSRSMSASISSAPRGRRKNDLMPTVPYTRTATPRAATSSSTRKRSVSMTRLDQLALPRRHYVEANKANSTASSGDTIGMQSNIKSPNRPLSSASETSGGSGHVPSTVTRRVRSSPRKQRPVSIAGTLPDHRLPRNDPSFEVKLSPVKRSYTPNKKSTEASDTKRSGTSAIKSSTPKSEKMKATPRPSTAIKPSTPKTPASKPAIPKTAKQTEHKPASALKAASPKAKEKKPVTTKKKSDIVIAPAIPSELKEVSDLTEKQLEASSQALDTDVSAENETGNAKRIISEEEAKAALAEKRRLAREQAEREAELERQRQEELKQEEEERIRREEEEQRKMEEEQLRLLEEHRLQEEEKLRRAIEEQEQKEAEEKAKRDEEMRMKAEQERKAKEEAEKQRIELEEKLRKEEEERAERKKRLEKIMSRTRGKSSGTSPSGSVSGSDQLDSGENAHEGFSSGANSLDSNDAEVSEQVSLDDPMTKAETSSVGDSMEGNPTYEIGSETESLNSNDLMMPVSEIASQDNSLVIIPEKDDLNEEMSLSANASSPAAIIESQDKKTESTQLTDDEDTTIQEIASVPMVSANSPILGSVDDHSTSQAIEDGIINDPPVPDSKVQIDNSQSEGLQQESQAPQFGFESEQLFTKGTIDELKSEPLTPSHSTEDSVQNQFDAFVSEIEENNRDLSTAIAFNENTVDVSLTNKMGDSVWPNDPVWPKENSLLEEIPSETIIETNVDAFTGAEMLDPNRSSISSDIKLPDPIYEISDDGSISSEKLVQDFKTSGQVDEFGFAGNQENLATVDDVFSEHSIPMSSGPFAQDSNPFAMNGFTENESQSSPSFNNFGINDNMYGNVLPDVMDQPFEPEEENMSSTSNVIESDMLQNDSKQGQNFFHGDSVDNKENLENDCSFKLETFNQFTNNEIENYNTYDNSNKENLFSAPSSTVEAEMHHFEERNVDVGAGGDDPFVCEPFSGYSQFQANQCEVGNNCFTQKHVFSETELVDNFRESCSSKPDELSNVTYIKSGDDGACIGIISSVNHDQVLNDFPKPILHSEQLRNNFEYSSITDSEESSLDSNLSQIITAEEESEKDTEGGLNHVKNSILESDSSKLVYSNGGHANPFESEHIYSNDSISKLNVNSFSASEVFSNGHRLESSNQVAERGFVQFDGNDILPVDHPMNNKFENVDAIDYSKGSPDPFLAKGNSIQMSGNPFLGQDDQKQVLMAPDFLN